MAAKAIELQSVHSSNSEEERDGRDSWWVLGGMALGQPWCGDGWAAERCKHTGPEAHPTSKANLKPQKQGKRYPFALEAGEQKVS